MANEHQIERAARTLIGLVLATERDEGERSTGAELTLEISMADGGTETWTITIERTASTH